MARKKKEETSATDNNGYDVLVGFIKDFSYREGADANGMNGHPTIGKCYQIIKDPQGYRIHIGRENNENHLDGLWLGETLKGVRKDYSFDIIVVTPENFLDLPIEGEEAKKVEQWITTNHAEIWGKLQNEIDGSAVVVKSFQELQDLEMKDVARHIAETLSKALAAEEPTDPEYLEVKRMEESLNTVQDKDPEMFSALVDVFEYIASTYSDKYESPELGNISKPVLTKSASLGKGANVFNIIKYAQRYGTTGFEKSENIKDIMKAIHYGAFEIQRKRYNAQQNGKV